MKIFSLLPLLLLFAVGSADTIFRANGTLTCHYHWPTWCYTIQYWEKDVSVIFNMDDLIVEEGTICRQSDTIDFFVEGTQDWDGINDHFFETQLEITHNCTWDGDLRRAVRKMDYTRTTEKESLIIFNQDITHKGHVVYEYFKAH